MKLWMLAAILTCGFSFISCTDDDDNSATDEPQQPVALADYTSTYPTERPKTWKLMAKRNETDAWTTISTVSNDTRLPKQSGQSARYDLSVTGKQWQYFRLEISATQGSASVNLGDLELEY